MAFVCMLSQSYLHLHVVFLFACIIYLCPDNFMTCSIYFKLASQRCSHLQGLLSKWVGPCRLMFCIWKKPLDHGPLRLNKQTWQVLTISFIIGLAPVAVYTAILMSRTAFSKMEWTQSRKGCFWCQSFDPMEDFKPPQQKLGRCLGGTGVMDFHGLSSLTMHFFLFQVADLQQWERQAGSKDLFEDLTHVLRI